MKTKNPILSPPRTPRAAGLFAALAVAASCLAYPRVVSAAFEEKIPSARPAALGGAFVAVPNDASAVFFNPGALGGLPGANISVTQTNIFNLPDLPYMTVAGAFPTRNLGTLSFGYTQFGPSFYRETEMTFSHSFSLARKFFMGYNVRNQSLEMKTFGSASTMGADIGFYGSLLSNLSAGICVKNINNPTLGPTAETLPQIYRIGLAYYPAVGVTFLLETSKDMNYDDLAYHGGGEVNLSKNFAIRAGVRTNPTAFSMGFGAGFGIFKLNYAMVNHPILDTQHLFTLGLKFGPEDDVAPAEGTRRRATRRSSRSSASRVEKYEKLKDFKINPNKATSDELKEIPGVGALTAQRIIDFREQGGVFATADDMLKVPRLTKRTLEKIRPYLVFDDSAVASPAISAPPISAPKAVEEPARKTPSLRGRQTQKDDDDDMPTEPDEEAAVVPAAPAVPVEPPKTAPQPVKTEKPKTEPAPKISAPVVAPPMAPVAPAVPVPVVPKVAPAPPAPPAPAPEPPKSAAPVSDDMLDINTAGQQELQVIGFTSNQAKNIIRYRGKEGNFSSVDDILKVPGVDAGTLEKTREFITAR